MPIIVGEGQTFERPPAGLYHAVCCDVIDRGEVLTRKGEMKHKVGIRWQLDARGQSGERFVVQKVYTASLFDRGPGQQSILAGDLQSWRGIPFTPDERKGFDLERLIGVNCQITIVHHEVAGVVYANVTTIVQLGKGMAKLAVENYTRQVNRPPAQGGGTTGPIGANPPPPVEDPIPF